jgi:hypothetical protein
VVDLAVHTQEDRVRLVVLVEVVLVPLELKVILITLGVELQVREMQEQVVGLHQTILRVAEVAVLTAMVPLENT